MPDQTMIDIPPCPQCGHTWRERLETLQKKDQEIYRRGRTTHDYRVHCPHCGTYFIVTVQLVARSGDRPHR